MLHPKHNEIRAAVIAGEKYDWICDTYKVSRPTIRRIRLQLGIPDYGRKNAGEKVIHKGKLIYKSKLDHNLRPRRNVKLLPVGSFEQCSKQVIMLLTRKKANGKLSEMGNEFLSRKK
jgi:hypothetical protein